MIQRKYIYHNTMFNVSAGKLKQLPCVSQKSFMSPKLGSVFVQRKTAMHKISKAAYIITMSFVM